MSKALVPWLTKASRASAVTKSATSPSEQAEKNEHQLSVSGLTSEANQSGSNVGRDQIGNYSVTHNHVTSTQSNIDTFLAKLQAEMESNLQTVELINRLQRFTQVKPYDGAIGLEAKLKVAGREYEFDNALEMKELFVKLLERFSHYASAQEILAYLLARAEYGFNQFVYPEISELRKIEINRIVDERIIAPTVEECSASVLSIDHSVAMGMIYWLADKCHVRWHS
ncbi:hypothetical protein Q8W71_27000 [Methylobacterium sp. NEAU 140]|uniref:ABC-three component system protein n=1 Tax=Methylobacterium sp. NEAU 140 TaxID=3064945 RepID=UPI0027372E50|nr:ABC-three component system protein [Methylobacterium sp. NEAU 140]MDP4026280.1 hypothetical protein [Methylobacterium sp. NEAU 140]